VSGAAGGGTQGVQGSVGQQALDIKALADMVNASNAELFAKVLEDARNASTPEMKEAAENYVEELKTLTETLARVSEQAEHMTRDAKEMDNLNRTLTGINTIYEMQLKSISTQVGTIDQINEQTRKMARQIEELNGIYNRMIQALTVNMKHTPGGSITE
jgi:predicted RNase H-like nuclease (RuvC/YqgF family)